MQNLKVICTHTHTLYTSFIERLFDSLKPLTVLDPNFLPIIMFICPKPELPNLLVQVPSHLSVTWLSSCYLVETKGYWNKDDVSYLQ